MWYREPAADRPTTPRPSGPVATAEWVRALPVGNGRLGAMVFGGVVHERLQLNEGTLWAGRPYDPVNPEAKGALPEVRRLLADRRYTDAAALASARVMAKPLAQMPYQSLGDLSLTFGDVDAVEAYRRDLDLTTATARVSYTVGDVVVRARGLRQRARPGDRRASDREPARPDLVRSAPVHVAARDGRGDGRRRSRDARASTATAAAPPRTGNP